MGLNNMPTEDETVNTNNKNDIANFAEGPYSVFSEQQHNTTALPRSSEIPQQNEQRIFYNNQHHQQQRPTQNAPVNSHQELPMNEAIAFTSLTDSNIQGTLQNFFPQTDYKAPLQPFFNPRQFPDSNQIQHMQSIQASSGIPYQRSATYPPPQVKILESEPLIPSSQSHYVPQTHSILPPQIPSNGLPLHQLSTVPFQQMYPYYQDPNHFPLQMQHLQSHPSSSSLPTNTVQPRLIPPQSAPPQSSSVSVPELGEFRGHSSLNLSGLGSSASFTPGYDMDRAQTLVRSTADNEYDPGNWKTTGKSRKAFGSRSARYDFYDESELPYEQLEKMKLQRGGICEICGKVIMRDMSRHMRIHEVIGRFRCVYPRRYCVHKTGRFNRQYDFKKHLLHFHFKFDDRSVRRIHSLNKKLSYTGTCPCGEKMTGGEWLDNHILTTDEESKCSDLKEKIQHEGTAGRKNSMNGDFEEDWSSGEHDEEEDEEENEEHDQSPIDGGEHGSDREESFHTTGTATSTKKVEDHHEQAYDNIFRGPFFNS